MNPIVLSLCDLSGIMVRPWLNAGYECWIVDTQHPEGENREGNLVRVGADIRTWLPPRRDYVAAFGFPPCTHLAVSGARWFQDKGLPKLIEGLEVVEATRRILEWTGAPWALENPVGTLSTYWRKPDHYFDPCEFGGWVEGEGDHYTKKTCLWVGGGFQVPERKPVEVIGKSPIHHAAPGPDRANFRSLTPVGFAYAVYAANRPDKESMKASA